MERTESAGILPCHRPDQRLYSEDLHYSLQVVRKDMQAHLRTDSGQCLGQEMRLAHPGFQRAEDMLYRSAADFHGFRCLRQPRQHSLQDMFMAPSLHRRYPVSSVLRAFPPPQDARNISHEFPVAHP